MAQHEIALAEMLEAIAGAQLLENYPTFYQGPACLISGDTNARRPIHIVCSTTSPTLILITVYVPTPPKWRTPTQRGCPMIQPCRMPGCPGHYERERIAQALRFPDTLIVIDDTPADVCDICGDTLYAAEVARRLDRVMRERPATSATVPLYRYEEVGGAFPAPLDRTIADVADAQ